MVVFSVPEDASFNGRVIYKFTSPVNKGYVGKATEAHRRIHAHKYEARAKKDGEWVCNSEWKQAIREFGWENLRVEILERVAEGLSLDERERFWIAKLKTKYPSGYNSNKGGGGPAAGVYGKPVTSRQILESYDDGTQLVKFDLYPSAQEAERKTGIYQGNISACCLGKKNSVGNRFWHFTKEGDRVEERRVPSIGDVPMPGNEQRKRAVISTSPSPERKKQRHESSFAAKRTLSKSTGKKFNRGHVSSCCSGKRKSHHGYTFRFETPDEAAEFEKNTKKRKRK